MVASLLERGGDGERFVAGLACIVGDGEGQVALPKLARHVQKLPRNLRGPQITEVRSRLRALGTQPVAMPKGPLPRGAKLPRGGMPPPQQR